MSYHAGSPQIAQGGFSQPQRKLSSQDCSIAENELSTRSDSFVVASLSRNIANDISNLTSEAFSDAEPQVL